MANTTKKTKKTPVEEIVKNEPQTAPETAEVKTEIKKVEEPQTEVIEDKKPTVERKPKKRSARYVAARKKVNRDKLYELSEAVKLVKETSLSKFEGKVEAHLLVIEAGQAGEISFPHMATGSKKIAICNDTIIAEIKEGKINFDLLVATPAQMPKLLPLARVLGPKGLMPNPKNGTLVDNPEAALKKLSVAKTIIKTEKKAPVVHIICGKTSQPESELQANLEELINVVKAKNIKKMTICATMGPGIKIKVN